MAPRSLYLFDCVELFTHFSYFKRLHVSLDALGQTFVLKKEKYCTVLYCYQYLKIKQVLNVGCFVSCEPRSMGC